MTWRRAWVRLRRDVVDALVVALAIVVEVEIVVKHGEVNEPVLALAGVFFVLPLLWRRRFPLAAPCVSLAAFTLAATIDPSGLSHIDFGGLAGIAVLMTLGTVRDGEGAIVGLALGMTAVIYVQSRFPDTTTSDLVGALVFYGGAWLAGRALKTRADQTRELRARVAQADRARALAVEQASADERSRIARELHDVVAHSVSVMVVQTSGVRRLLREEQRREREALLSVEQIGRQALTEMRRMLGLMPTGTEGHAVLAPQPGLQHLDELIAKVEAAGLPVTLRLEGEQLQLPPGVDLSAYRIVQEGLDNALKHANGSQAEVVVRFDDRSLHLEVVDDGEGGEGVPGELGRGLVGMRERVALFGGTLEAGPRDGGGFVLSADLPIEVRS